MMALALTIGAQAQEDDGMDAMLAAMIAAKIHQDSIDTSSLVAVYDYECQTQDADGKAVTDRMKVCLQVGQHCMRSFPYRKFREDTEGYDTVRDAIPPTIYETQEERKPINWELSDDTLTVAGFLCKFATCQLHGRKWTALYSEDIPTSAGPWKLCGLPGLILKAEADGGIHRFTLVSLQRIASPIYSETNAITSKTSEEKLIKNRIKTFGNRLYPKNPYYYITVNLNRTADVTSTNEGMIINNVFVNDKAYAKDFSNHDGLGADDRSAGTRSDRHGAVRGRV